MLQAIRDRATGWIAYGIIGLLIIPFAFWGIDQYQGGGQINVAEVGGVEITLTEFQRALQEQQSRLQAMFGNQLDPDFFDQDQLKQDVLRRLVDQRLLTLASVGEGYRIGDQELVGIIREIPAFQTDGVFDPERFRVVLQRQGRSAADFEAALRSDLATSQLEGGVQSSSFATGADVDAVIRVRDQTRAVAFATLAFTDFESAVELEDSEVEAWFADNRTRFEAPERVRIEYVELDAALLGGDAEIDEQELREFYEQQRDRFVTEEQRTASHIHAPIAAGATSEESDAARQAIERVHTALTEGSQSFDEAMVSVSAQADESLEAGELGLIAEGMLDPALESAVFELENVNDFSGPVRSDFGYHLVRLDGVEPGIVQSFEDVTEELRVELQNERGEGAFFEQAENLANLSYESPDSLEPAAEAIGLEIKTSAWFDRNSGTGIAEDRRVRELAFADDVLTQGLNSEIVELSPTRAVVLRVLDHEEARQRELDEVRGEVETALREEKARENIAAAADSLLEAARGGRSLEALAEEEGIEWTAPRSLTRSESDMERPLLDTAFRLPRPESAESPSYGIARLANGDRAVLTVTEVTGADPGSVEEESRSELARSLSQQEAGLEFAAVVESLRDRIDIRIYPENL